jgi:hypothetical protein
MSMGPIPPGPSSGPRVPAPGGRPSRLPLLLAGLALIVALVGTGTAAVALSRTGDAPAMAAPTSTPSIEPTVAPTATDATATTDPLPTDATVTTDPTEEPTSEPTDGPDPAGVYTVAYRDEPLRLQPSSRYIDLDEPSGNSLSSASELQYNGFSPSFKFDFGNVALASVNSATASANDCALQLRRAPIDREFAAAKGQVVCVLTSRQAADNQGMKQKIVLLRVASIGQDGTLNLILSAWNVPR